MANDFVRNIKGVRNINKLSPNITTENDLISTIDNEVYVVTNDGYKKITGGETEQDIQVLETDVKKLKTSTGNNTSEIETLKTSTDNNTTEIENLQTSTGNNTSDIETLKTSTDNNTSKIRSLQTSTDNNTSEIETLKKSIGNSTSEMNDFIHQKQNEKNYMNFLKENSVITSNNTISLTGDRNINTVINLSDKDNVNINFRKNNNDDFIKFRNLDYEVKGDLTEPSLVNEDFTDSMVSNSLRGSKGNYYTTTVGTKITFTFKGENISLRYYTDVRGGVWKASIDDVFVKNISTHTESQNVEDLIAGTTYKTLIKDNMENIEHTLILEFMGEDESFPSDTPRGWIKQSNNDDLYTFNYLTSETGDKGVITNALYDSNKEFAFDISYNNTREWVPEHNNTGTLMLSNTGKQQLLIDGKAYSINEPLSETSFTEVKILQNLYGINSSNGDKICNIICVCTITSQGIKFNTKVIWLKELTINAGYVNMFTLNPKFADSLTTSYGNNYSLNIYDNSYEYLEENAPYSFVGLSDKYDDIYLTCDNINGYNSLRIEHDDRDGDKYGNGLFAIQHRNENLQKLYPRTYTNHTTSVGEVYEFEGFYGYGKLPMVNELLK